MSEQKTGISGERIKLLDRYRHLEEAERHKLIRYVVSGSFIVLAGLILVSWGFVLYSSIGTAYSLAGLLIGIGIIVVLIGVIRILIGLINPWSPSDLAPPRPPAEDLDTALGFVEEE
jgi:hypothetical protein